MDHGGLQARFSHCLSKCFREISLHFHSEGRWGGGIVCQDSLKHILWRSILGFLPRTVLADNTPSPASTETEYIYQKPLAHDFAHPLLPYR